jgi:hypothetical protein
MKSPLLDPRSQH